MDLDALRSALDESPGDSATFESLQDALISAGDLANLKEVYDSVFGVLDDGPERDKLLRIIDSRARNLDDEGIKHWLNAQLGLLYWKQFEKPEKAEVYFRRVQAAAGQGGVVTEFYIEYYTKRGNWRRLEQLYADQGMESLEIKRTLARQADEQGKKDKALSYLQAVFKEDSSDTETYHRLRELLTDLGKWHSLAEMLKNRLKGLSEDAIDEKVELLMEMIGLFEEHIKSDTKVISTWQAILEIQPDNVAAQDALESLYIRMKRWPDLVRVLKARIESSEDLDTRIELHSRVAELMLERFSNVSEAIKQLQAVLELDSEHLSSIQQLKGLYEQRNAWDQYIDVARREITLTTDDEAERSAALFELAQVASQKIRNPKVGVELWEEIRNSDPENVEALKHLEGLYEREKAFEKLVDVLDVLHHLTDDVAERVRLLEKMGQIYGSRLDDSEKTGEVWLRLLELDSSHRKAFNELRKRALADGDLEQLEWLFRTYGTVSELVRAFESQVKTAAADAQVPLLAKVADLCLEEGKNAKAIKALTSILAIDSRHSESAKRLIPLYVDAGSWAKLPDVYDVVIDTASGAQDRQGLLVAKATVLEERLNDVESAYFCYVSAYQEDYHSGEIRAQLDRLAELSSSWNSYVSVLEGVVERMESTEHRVETLLHAASVQYTRLEDTERALAHYNNVLNNLEPGNAVAMGATEQIYRDSGRWLDLVSVLDAKLTGGGLGDDDEKALRFEIGAIWRDNLGDPESAVNVYREMMDLFSGDTRIHDELANLYLQTQDFEQLGQTLDAKLHILVDSPDATGADLADLHCKLAMLAHASRDDLTAAIEHYTEALTNDAHCVLAVSSLEELLASAEHRQQIARTLETIYTDQGRDESLADVLEIQLEGASAKVKKSLLGRLVELYFERIEDAEKSLWAASRLFELDPNRAKIRAIIEVLCESLDEWLHLADLYEANASKIKKDATRIAVYETVAQTAQRQLNDVDRAERNYISVLDEDPEHEAALDSLELLYLDMDHPEKLLGILRKKADLCESDDDRIDLRFQTASILATRLQRFEDAIDDIRDVLGMQPENPTALARLDELLGQVEAWADLQDVLETRARLADDDAARASILVRLATIQEHQLDNVFDAINTFGRILEFDNQRIEAVAALERLFDAEETAAVVASLLEPTYEARGDNEGLIRVYKVIERDTDESEIKVGLHYQIAGLYEYQLNDMASAFSHYASAFSVMPENQETLNQLLRLADSLENHRELTELIKSGAEDVDDPDRRRELYRVTAQTLRDRCSDVAGAIEHYQTVLELEETDIGAVDALIDLYRISESFGALVSVLRRKAGLMTVDALRKELLAEAGAICWTQLQNAEDAVGIYQDILAIDPDDLSSTDALIDLYRQTQQWLELTLQLSRKIELVHSEAEQKELAQQLAIVQDLEMDDPESAIQTRRMILGWDDADLSQWQALDSLLIKTEQWHELLEVVDRQIALIEGAERVDLMLRKATVLTDEIVDVVSGIDVLRAVLEIDPSDTRAVASLEVLVRKSDNREMAFTVLRPVLESGEQWVQLYDLLDTLVVHREDPYSRIEALQRMGQLAEDMLGEPTRAFGCYGRALQQDLNHSDSMAAVERLAAAHELWEELTHLLQDGASSCDDPIMIVQLRLRAGDILMENIGDAARAISAFVEVREEEPDNGRALGALDQLYERTEAWQELADIVQARLDIVGDPNQKTDLLFRLADVAENRLDNQDIGFECYREIFYADQTNPRALENLERLARTTSHRQEIAEMLEGVYEQNEAWFKLHEMLELRLEITPDSVDRQELFGRLAAINLEHLERPSDALRWLSQSFELDAEDDHLLSRMEQLAEVTGLYSALNDTLLNVVGGLEDDARKVTLWHKSAQMLRDQLSDAAGAENIFKLIRQTDPTDLAALKALDRMYVDAQRWDELETILDDQIDNVEFEDEQVGLLMRLAELQRDRLGRAEDAVGSFKRVLDVFDSHSGALQALADLYTAFEDYAALYGVVKVQCEQSNDDQQRMTHFRQLAQLAENHLSEPGEAVEFWEEILNVNYSDLEAVQNVQRLHRQAHKFEDLAEALERELNVVRDSDSARAAVLYREMAQLQGTHLEDQLQAQQAWEQLLTIEAHDDEAFQALLVIHEEADNPDSLSDVLEKMVASGQYQGDDGLALYVKMARLYTDVLANSSRAIWAWERVLEHLPENMEAIQSLEQLFLDEGNWDRAASIMEIKAGLVGEEAAVGVFLALGEMLQYQAGRWEDAASAYHRLLRIVPAHEEAHERLDGLYSENAQWASLVSLLDDRVQLLEDGDDKRELLIRLTELQEHQLEDRVAALMYSQAAHSQQAGDIDVLSTVERLANETENWDALVGEYVRAIAAFDDPEDKIEYGLRRARVLRDKSHDADSSIEAFNSVLELDEEHEEALRDISMLYGATERWEQLVSVLERRIENAGDSMEQTELGLEVARVYRYEIRDVEQSIEAYKRVIDIGDSEGKAVAELEVIYTEYDRFRDLIDVLELKVEMGLGEELEIKLQIAGILESALEDTKGAITAYEDVLTLNDTHRHSLERLVDLYAATDDFDSLTEVYERLLHSTQVPEEQLLYCENLALLHRQVHENTDDAADYFHKMLEIDPAHSEAFEALESLYEETGQWEELIDAYRKRLEQVPDDDAAWITLKERTASVYSGKLEDPDNAIYTYQELLERFPANRAALDALDQLYRLTEQPEQVQEILRQKADHALSAEERLSLMSDRAQLVMDDLSDADLAIEILNEVLAQDDGNTRALSQLESVYTEQENWEQVIDVLQREYVHAVDDVRRAEVQRRIAAVYIEQLNDTDQAITHYELALEAIPDDTQAGEKLARLYLDMEAWIKAETLLTMIINRVPEDADSNWLSDLHFNLGLALENLLRPEDALREYERAYELTDNVMNVARALGRLAFDAGDLDRAETIYKGVVDELGDDATEEELIPLYRTLGQVALKRGNAEQAREYFESALSFQPGDVEALKQLLEVSIQQGYTEGVVNYTTELMDLLNDDLEKFELQVRLGDIYLEKQGSLDEAVEAYQAALDFAPTSKAAHLKIFQVLEKAERHTEAAEILQRLVELETDDPKRKATFCGAIGDLYKDKIDDAEQAIHWYNEALDADSTLLKLFLAMDAMLTERKDWSAQQKNYRRMLKRVENDPTQTKLQHQLCFNLGEVYRSRLESPDKAKAAFEAAINIKPNDTKALEILSELYIADNEFEMALKNERRLLSNNPSELRHYRRLKKIFLELGDMDAAWVACGVLCLLDQADEKERNFYQEYASGAMAVDTDALSDDIWSEYIFGENEDTLIGKVFHELYRGMGESLSHKELKDLGLKKKNQLDLTQREMFTHVYNSVASLLSMNPVPEVYVHEKGQGIQIEECLPPIVAIGSDVRQDKTEQELAFVLAKVLTYFHPLHVATCMLGPETLQYLLMGAFKLYVPGFDVGALEENENFQDMLVAMTEMPTQSRNSLGKWLGEIQARGTVPNVQKWLNQIELTAIHAGLVLCNDVVEAGRIVKNEQFQSMFTAPSRLSTRDKLVDLAVYALSERHINLRKALGVTVDA